MESRFVIVVEYINAVFIAHSKPSTTTIVIIAMTAKCQVGGFVLSLANDSISRVVKQGGQSQPTGRALCRVDGAH